jgi:hypothetical protein
MSNQINVNTTTNQVTVTQGTTQIVTVAAQGPAGPQGAIGPAGPSGSTVDTGSFATTGSNSFIGDQIITGSLIISGSSTFTNIGPAIFSGSLNITEGITGSFSGTATSASFAVTASHALFAVSASHEIVKEVSSSHANFADTASGLFGTPSISVNDVTASGDVLVSQFIKHTGDVNTLINFTDNRIRFKAGDIGFFDMEKDASVPYPATINPGGNRVNFRVNDRNTNLLLKTDSELFKVNLYHSGNQKLETAIDGINVTGNISASGDIIVSNITSSNISASGDLIGNGLTIGGSTGPIEVFDNPFILKLASGSTGGSNDTLRSSDKNLLVNSGGGFDTVQIQNAGLVVTSITASGGISASGVINGQNLFGGVFGRIYPDSSQTSNNQFFTANANGINSNSSFTVTGNVTASSNISASGDISAVTASLQRIEFPDDSDIISTPAGHKLEFGASELKLTSGDDVFLQLDDTITFANAQTNIPGNIIAGGTISNISTTHVTSSGNISASGDIIGGGLNINGTTTFNEGNITNVGGIFLDFIQDDGANGTSISLNPSDIRFAVAETLNVFTVGASGNVTASGNISSSAQVIGNSFKVQQAVAGPTDTSLIISGSTFDGDARDAQIIYPSHGLHFNDNSGNNNHVLALAGNNVGVRIQPDGNAALTVSGSISMVEGDIFGATNITASGNISASGDIIANKVTADVVDTSFETFLNFEAATAFTFIAPFPMTINFTGSSTSSMDVAGFVTASANTSTFSVQQTPPITLDTFDKLKITPSASGLFSFSGSRTI